MKDRTGQTWQENNKMFVVVGAPTVNELWSRHPICYIDDQGVKLLDTNYLDEGDIAWENQPYMTRVT